MYFVTAVTLLSLIAGLYLSGYLTLWLLKVDTGLLRWDTYLIYFRALDLPEVAPFAAKIKWGGYLGFGLPAAAWLALGVLTLRPREKSLHGEARFAGRGDLAKRGLLKPSPDGIVVGKVGNTLIRLPGQQFAILAAPTRSGKGVGIVVPNLLEYQDSVVVLDIKQENFDLTSGWRESQGQKIYLFNPYAEDRRTHRWNPMSYVSGDPAFRISSLQAIAAILYPDGSSQDKFWVSQARNAFLAFALYLYENYDEQRKRGYLPEVLAFPTLGQVFRLTAGKGEDLKTYLTQLSDRPFLSKEAKAAFAGLLSQEKETFASIMGTVREPLNPWLNPVLDAATSHNDFWLTDVRKQKMTIYVGIQPHKLAECRTLINLFFSQLINVNVQTLPQNDKRLKHQCLLLMDEFTAIGKLEIFASAISFMAGYNLRAMPIIQSMSQLESVYGKDVARTLVTNHALQIVFAPREQQDANEYSEMLGYTTVRKNNITRGRDFSRSESHERRALMLPQELKAMGPDKEIILYEGMAQPVLCNKIRYFSDTHFKNRIKNPVKIPELK
nr:type IV secretory system conjugative DNA transfer family protein [Luteimonas galliterrae]